MLLLLSKVCVPSLLSQSEGQETAKNHPRDVPACKNEDWEPLEETECPPKFSFLLVLNDTPDSTLNAAVCAHDSSTGEQKCESQEYAGQLFSLKP